MSHCLCDVVCAYSAFRFSHKNAAANPETQVWHKLAVDLSKLIVARDSAQVMLSFLDKEVTPTLGAEARIRLWTPCILEAGNKSYSHCVAFLERYQAVFQALSDRPKDSGVSSSAASVTELFIIHSVAEYWQHCHQHFIVTIDKMFSLHIIGIHSLIQWCFQKPNAYFRFAVMQLLAVSAAQARSTHRCTHICFWLSVPV